VQYAFARINSVMNKANEAGIDVSDTALATSGTINLAHDAELIVAKKLAEWPRLLELAAKHHEPHRIAFYLYELASDFHSLWNRGKDEPDLRFLQNDKIDVSQGKISLIRAVSVVISAGLGILGVTPMEEMR
jgi:arginyl-tRNA synthetase